MQLEGMRYFVELARAGSFNSAAKNLFISSQGLNKAISSIEQEFGMRLVERSRHGVTLTPAGREFLRHAQVIVAEIGAMVDDMALAEERAQTEAKPLEVVASSYALTIFAGLPTVEHGILSIAAPREEPFEHIFEEVEQSTGDEVYLLELYPSMARDLAEQDLLAFEPLLSTRVGIIWRDGCELAGKKTVEREDLRDVPIAYNSHHDMRTWTEDFFAPCPLGNVQLRTSAVRLLIEFAHGKWVSLFDSYGFYVAKADPGIPTEGLCFTPLSAPEARAQVGFLYRRDTRPNARCRRLIELIKRVFRDAYAPYLSMYPVEPLI